MHYAALIWEGLSLLLTNEQLSFYLWVATLLTLDVFGCRRQEELR